MFCNRNANRFANLGLFEEKDATLVRVAESVCKAVVECESSYERDRCINNNNTSTERDQNHGTNCL